ncbi:MAG: DUF1287 domain-containing protein [Thermosynechococcaceae cyanobacterium]
MAHYRSYFTKQLLLLISTLTLAAGCTIPAPPPFSRPKIIEIQVTSPKLKQLLATALEQTKVTHTYDPAYVAIAYPGGDVPSDRGVCTDVVIRAFRGIGIDLQKEVHEDMAAHFAAYPPDWGLTGPDPNIDHRRVPNLMTYLERQGKAIALTQRKEDYLPGDIVTWDLGQGQQHIGLVTQFKSERTGQFMIVHNIGSGTQLEDVLLNWPVIGHYRYLREQPLKTS